MRRLTGLILAGALLVGVAALVRWPWWRETPAGRHLRAGNAFAGQGNIRRAAQEWQVATALDPNLLEPHAALARAYFDDGALALAIREWTRLAALDPHYPHVYCALGEAYLEAGLSDEAQVAAGYAARLEPRCARPHRTLGIILADRQDYQRALAELQLAATLAPRDAAIRVVQARMYLGLRQLDRAETHAREAYRLNPRDPGAAFLLPHLLIRRNDPRAWNEAEGLLRTAVVTAETDPEVHFDLAQVHQARGRLTEARREMERAIQLAPRHQAAIQQLAEVCGRLGDTARAAALRRQGEALAAEGLARLELERQLARQPDDGRALYRLGDLYARDGQYMRAIDMLERASQILTSDATIRQRLTQVRAEARQVLSPPLSAGKT
jgi:Flp pilus assembly protein TadD